LRTFHLRLANYISLPRPRTIPKPHTSDSLHAAYVLAPTASTFPQHRVLRQRPKVFFLRAPDRISGNPLPCTTPIVPIRYPRRGRTYTYGTISPPHPRFTAKSDNPHQHTLLPFRPPIVASPQVQPHPRRERSTGSMRRF
jgi:hypothetical protein